MSWLASLGADVFEEEDAEEADCCVGCDEIGLQKLPTGTR